MHRWGLVLFIVLVSASLHGEILFYEDFSGPSTLDSLGWTEYAINHGNWQLQDTGRAGGEAPEVRFYCNWVEDTDAYIESPAIPVSGQEELLFLFHNYLEYNTSYQTLRLRVQVKEDDDDWRAIWVDRPTSNHGSRVETIALTAAGVDTLRVRFALNGYAQSGIRWNIDNIMLKEPDIVIADSTWVITEDVLIDSSRALYISGDSEIQFAGPYALTIAGGVEITGTPTDPIEVQFGSSAIEAGIIMLMQPTMPCAFTHCNFASLAMYPTRPHLDGGAIYALDAQDLTFESCEFNQLKIVGDGGGVYAFGSNVSFTDCLFDGCESDKGGAIYAELCDVNVIRGRVSECSGSTLAAAVYGTYSTIGMHHTLIDSCGVTNRGRSILHFANVNTVLLDHITIAGCDVTDRGIISANDSTSVTLTNSILWNKNNDAAFYLGQPTTVFTVSYIDHNGSYYIAGGSTLDVDHRINENPLFADPANDDFTLLEESPCIDAGDPDYTPRDEDGTIADLGYSAFYQYRPIITNLADVPDDQGRQLQCVWRACEFDSTYTQAQYYVWREDDVFDREGAIVITSYDQLAELEDEQPDMPVYLLRDDVVWCWVATVPALCRDFYSCIVPTLQDSCSTATNKTTCMITYADANDFWDSKPLNGYSLDNIPPMSPERFDISRSGGAFTLAWSEVTDGELNGNTYPEQNGVWYRVYAGDAPDFVADEASLVDVTQDLSLIWSGTAERKFFKVVAADQE